MKLSERDRQVLHDESPRIFTRIDAPAGRCAARRWDDGGGNIKK